MRKKSIIVISILVILIVSLLCAKKFMFSKEVINTKAVMKNYIYEGEGDKWKVKLIQYKNNDLDIEFKYKGLDKLSDEIKFGYSLDNGWGANGVIENKNNSRDFQMYGGVSPYKYQLKVKKVVIGYNDKTENIKLKCYEKNN